MGNEELFELSFDDIENLPEIGEDEKKVQSELSLYEKIYLYKKQDIDHEMMNKIAPLQVMSSDSLFENVVFVGFRRYYIEDLSVRNFNLENTTPYRIVICGKVIEDGSWGDLISKCIIYLLELYPDKRGGLYSFRASWTKADMFFEKYKTNSKCIDESLYINCNHTAVHSCWFLQELLGYFNIDKSSVYFLLHRPCSAESIEIKNYIYSRFTRGFMYYLITQRKKEPERAVKILHNINKYLNPLLQAMSKSYTNLFLFDDTTMAYSYAKKIKEKIDTNVRYQEKEKKFLNKNLSYLVDYYKL